MARDGIVFRMFCAMTPLDRPLPQAPHKSIGHAYLWWLPPMGWFGAHRFYLRRWYTGSAWAVSSGLLYIGWLADLFLLPRLVRTTNARLAAEFAEHPERFTVAERAIAAWAVKEETSRWERIAAPFAIYWYIVAPCLLVMLAYEAHLRSLVPIMLVVLVAAGFFVTPVEQLLLKHPVIEKLPGVNQALDPFRLLLATYQEHEPGVGRFLRKLFTKESVPYLKILGIVATGVLVEAATSFKDVYQPFLTMEDAASTVALQLVLTILLVGIVVIPVFTMSFRYSLSARQRPLRRYTTIALCLVVFVGFGYPYLFNDRDAPTAIAAERLSLRLEKPDFVRSLRQLTEMFLAYPDRARQETTPEKIESRLTRFSAGLEAFFDHPPTHSNSPELATAYRRLLRNIVPEEETHAFQVELAHDPQGTPWRISTYRPDSTVADTTFAFVIAARDGGGTVYRCDPLLKFAAHAMAHDSTETIDLSPCAQRAVVRSAAAAEQISMREDRR